MTNMNGSPDTSQNTTPHGAGPQGPADDATPVSVGPSDRETNKDARLWAMICHLAGFAGLLPVLPAFGNVVGPLIVWLIKKNDFPFVDEQGKEAVNFQITMLIYGIAAGLLIFACIGIVLLPAVAIVDIVFIIIAAIKVNEGQHYRYPYPLIIHFFR